MDKAEVGVIDSCPKVKKCCLGEDVCGKLFGEFFFDVRGVFLTFWGSETYSGDEDALLG